MSKMSWHDIPEDYVESPVADIETYSNDEGQNYAYVDNSSNQYDLLNIHKLTTRDILTAEQDIELMHQQYLNPDIITEQFFRPVDKPTQCYFNYKWHITSTQQESRNKIRKGLVYTQSQRIPIWGFDVWSECKNHVHPRDKEIMYKLRDELVTDIALSHEKCNLTYWIARSDGEVKGTRPDWWAITIDYVDAEFRVVYTHWNNKPTVNKNLQIKIDNTITYSY